MSFWRSPFGSLLMFLMIAATVSVGVLAVQVHRTTTPPRHAAPRLDFAAMRLEVENVEFAASDGMRLRGWLMPGSRGTPVILCHDRGGTRASLLNLALSLQREGFTLLLFDFRGHGESDGQNSSLGIYEKRDVLGAVDYLTARARAPLTRIGIYGVGMGAHAAVLAAADRPELGVLVLDELYPDAAFPLLRETFAGWRFGVDHLGAVPVAIFSVAERTRIGAHRAADIVPMLVGRDVLLLAPAGDSALAAQMQQMYEQIPEQPDVDGNLVVMPATLRRGLYGDDVRRYNGKVSSFFLDRLGQPGRSRVG